jgi:hypothetical protein
VPFSILYEKYIWRARSLPDALAAQRRLPHAARKKATTASQKRPPIIGSICGKPWRSSCRRICRQRFSDCDSRRVAHRQWPPCSEATCDLAAISGAHLLRPSLMIIARDNRVYKVKNGMTKVFHKHRDTDAKVIDERVGGQPRSALAGCPERAPRTEIAITDKLGSYGSAFRPTAPVLTSESGRP